MNSNSVYISQATQIQPFKPHTLNVVTAPVGSGKTTWIENVIYPAYGHGGIVLVVTPFLSLHDQLATNSYSTLGEINSPLQFDANWDKDFEIYKSKPHQLRNKKVVITLQKLLWEILNPQSTLLAHTAVVVLDEYDFAISDMRKWAGVASRDPMPRVVELILSQMVKHPQILWISISATGENVIRKAHLSVNKIEFKEKLRELPLGERIPFSSRNVALINALNKKKPHETVLFFTEQIRELNKAKEFVESQGYSMDRLFSLSNSDFEMNEKELTIRSHLMERGESELLGDVYGFNLAGFRGINILSPSICGIISEARNVENLIQAEGRARNRTSEFFSWFKQGLVGVDIFMSSPSEGEQNTELGMDLNKKLNSQLKLPHNFNSTYFRKPLFTAEKAELVELLQWRNSSGKLLGWSGVENELVSMGYKIENGRRINPQSGLRQRCSTIVRGNGVDKWGEIKK